MREGIFYVVYNFALFFHTLAVSARTYVHDVTAQHISEFFAFISIIILMFMTIILMFMTIILMFMTIILMFMTIILMFMTIILLFLVSHRMDDRAVAVAVLAVAVQSRQ